MSTRKTGPLGLEFFSTSVSLRQKSCLGYCLVPWRSWRMLRDAFHLAVGGVPREIELVRVQDYLSGLPGVREVHDLHVWGLSTAEVALTAHLVKRDPESDDELAARAVHDLQSKFEIDHVTLQWEREKLELCRQKFNGRRKDDLPEFEEEKEK